MGNFTMLRALGVHHGFRAEKIDPVRYKEFVVSSTRVRRLVAEGRVDEAGALLGHLYTLTGRIVEGDRRGRTLGFPTANLRHAERAAAARWRVRDRHAGGPRPARRRHQHRPASHGHRRSRRTIETT